MAEAAPNGFDAEMLAWLRACQPEPEQTSGSDFSQGVIRGFEIVIAQIENGHHWKYVRQPGGEDAELGAALSSVWQQARRNHERYSATGSLEDDIRFFALGLAGEAGELANFVKKRWRDGVGHDEAIQKEIADVLAYAFMLADRMGLSPLALIQIVAAKQQVFIAKMQAREEAA